MFFQHSSELAIQATLFLAQQAPGKLSPVREIAAGYQSDDGGHRPDVVLVPRRQQPPAVKIEDFPLVRVHR